MLYKPRGCNLKWVFFLSFLICGVLTLFGTTVDLEDLDYSRIENWVSLTYGESVTKAVDVFYVYPTVSSWETGSMDITVESERQLAQGIFKAQASLFQTHANVFAPYYRQMTTNVSLPDDPNAQATDTPEFKAGALDVQAAFDFYIENLNQGRPFIIAGHSQGSMALIELMKNKFGSDASLRDNLVAAYIIGYTVTDEDLQQSGLQCAKGETDTGVVITFNTTSPTSVGGPMLMPGAHCINPLNWKTDDTYAANLKNKGARFYNDQTGVFLREVNQYSDAQINMETGALMTNIPVDEELEIGPYPEGVFHRFDYAMWYRNLEENVSKRIDAYLNR